MDEKFSRNDETRLPMGVSKTVVRRRDDARDCFPATGSIRDRRINARSNDDIPIVNLESRSTVIAGPDISGTRIPPLAGDFLISRENRLSARTEKCDN